MAPRQKTRFERWLSFSRHRKRIGARRVLTPDVDFDELRARFLPGRYSGVVRGSDKSLARHIDNLRGEFAGQPEICFLHACLVVLIRREFQTAATLKQFFRLWDLECNYLCEQLNIRWLISAADTFAEYGRSGDDRAAGMMASVLVNTVKIYETERVLTQTTDAAFDPTLLSDLQTDLIPLFGGMSCFVVGTDDTLRNMFWRLKPFFKSGPPGRILAQVYDDLQNVDSAFTRLRANHQRPRTAWWD